MNDLKSLKLQAAIKAFNDGDFKKSEKILEEYVREHPSEFDPIHLLAVVYSFNLKHHDAISFYKIALSICPTDAQVLSNLATSLNAIGNHKEALAIQRKAIDLDQNNPDFWYNAGNILCDLGRFQESFEFYEKALAINPNSDQTLNNYGKALYDLERYADSIIYYDKALRLNPNFLECLNNKGVSLKELKKYDEAITCFDKALSLNPNYAEAFSNKGIVLYALRKIQEAILYFDKAISLNPKYAQALSNKGFLLQNEQKKFQDALNHFNEAIMAEPNYVEAWSNKASVLSDLNRTDDALKCYEVALSIKPDFDWLYGNFLQAKMRICYWDNFTENLLALTKKIAFWEKTTQPFVPLFMVDNPGLHKQCAEIFINKNFPENLNLGPIPKTIKKEKIKIAYFSADFGKHAVSSLVSELIELHDKNIFQIIGFSFGPNDNSNMRFRLMNAFTEFYDLNNLSDQEVAQFARKMNIDIAVDLGGFTGANRIAPFSYYVAPLQINYLGYPGTSGAKYIDYIIADTTLIPKSSQQFYTEKIIYLPNSYQANDRKRLISEKKFSRDEFGLPKDGFVFCCFNNNYKILPSTFDSWMRILKAIDGSVLWLLKDNSLIAKNLYSEAEKRGVSGKRLIFAERAPLAEHLARHRHANLFIDTFPYNAHTTASDALWAGVPVLTLKGQSFASRVAASLLNAIDLPELITTSQDQYEALALELATNTNKLSEIKVRLSNNRLTTPLFDTPLFTKNIESAYLKIYDQYLMGLKPSNLYI